MGTITLENVRATSDITTRVRLKDGGLAIDWSGMSEIKAWIFSDAQKALAGRCVVSVDQEDDTLLLCEYAATKPQYLGVNRIVVQCRYNGRLKTYDKPAFNLVARTAELAGDQIVLDDPVVDVSIEVQDVSSSILDTILAACIKATEEAREVVDVHRGPRGYSAYEVAVENGFEGTEEEWLLSLQGKSAYEIAVELGYEGTEEQWIASLKGEDGDPGTTPHIGQNGDWFIGETDTGVLARGTNGVTPHIGNNGHWFIGDTDTNVVAEGHDGAPGQNGAPGQDGADGIDGTDGITPHIGANGNWYIGDDDTEVPATGPAGQDGSPGITAEDVEDIQDIEETLAAVALKKTQQTLTQAELTQVWDNLGLTGIATFLASL